MIPLGKIGAALGIAATLGGGAVFAWPVIGDYPPLAGIARLNASADETRATIVKGQIDGLWSRYCEALSAKHTDFATIYGGQLAQRKDDYFALAKRAYLTEPCP